MSRGSIGNGLSTSSESVVWTAYTLLSPDPTLSEYIHWVSGKVTYNGYEVHEFVPHRTAAYISQHDLHIGEMTVRETLEFSARCQGVGSRYDMLAELSRREKEANIKPDPDLDIFMKAGVTEGQKANVVTDYFLKILGLDVCADTMVGDEMLRGISGGQKKRVTTGEMLVGPSNALFMDEISTGLDSSTAYSIVNSLRQYIQTSKGTAVISLLQPAPETYIGRVTSKKDQQQYWSRRNEPYSFITSKEFSDVHQSFHVGRKLSDEHATPFDRTKCHPAALTNETYGIGKKELLKVCAEREFLLMKRNSFIYIFKFAQLTIMALMTMTLFFRTEMPRDTVDDGGIYTGALFFVVVTVMFNGMAEMAMTIFKLPVFYKQRDLLFFPSWAYSIPSWILKIPVTLVEVGLWVILTYYVIGFDPNITRFLKQFLLLILVNQMASGLFRFSCAVGRTMGVANTFGAFSLLLQAELGGFILSRDDVKSWWIWCYWISPMMYSVNSILVNEFEGKKWKHIAPNGTESLEATVVRSRGFFPDAHWYWIGFGALFGFTVVFNFCYSLALAYLNPLTQEDGENAENSQAASQITSTEGGDIVSAVQNKKKGMILPFEPPSITFDEVVYSVDMPQEMKEQGAIEDRLVLLNGVSGAFRPGVLTALMGVSGAGKTTLMDVLAGRKTGGYINGDIKISGYPKKQETFARITGYCEQNDIHSPYVTVYESLVYSAWLRLPKDIDEKTRKLFLMKRGGQEIYVGPLGHHSSDLIKYFESMPGVAKIKEGYNPATWMLEVTTAAQEMTLGVDFTNLYKNSDLYRRKKALISELSVPRPGSKDLYFETQYSQSFWIQCTACLWKQHWSYWRNPAYTAVRFIFTMFIALVFRTMFWDLRTKVSKSQDLFNVMGSMYVAVLFLGLQNASSVFIEIPYVFVQAVSYGIIVYAMIGFEWDAGKFFWYVFIMYITLLYFTFYGMMSVAVMSNQNVASIVVAFFYAIWNLFSGFIVPPPRMPIWWRWYYWACPVAWTLYGLVASQFGDIESVEEFLRRYFGFKRDFLGVVAGVLVAYAVVFAFIFAFAIKAFNFQRR
ncbi:Pleiotropic drug resistance protein 1 [Capsicum chinense]|nr:Pleiotropic drug resistance protein 1 [Capsicum chinense]